MIIQVVNPVSGRRARIERRILGKVLHLACFRGWCPERLDSPPPSSSWDTEMVMPYLTPYLSGTVSDTDAAGLLAGLRRVLASEGAGLPSEVYLAVLALIAIAEGGGFGLKPEDASLAEGEAQGPPFSRRDGDMTLPCADRPEIGLGGRRNAGF